MTITLERQRFEALSRDFQRKKGQVELLKSNHRQMVSKLGDISVRLTLETETTKLLQLSSATTWDTTKQLVESLVTRALRAIFYDRDYRFLVRQEVKRNANSVTFLVVENGLELDLVDELGGGISDVVSLVLRIAFLSLYRPQIRPFLVLDEPLKHLWSGYQPNAGKFLKQACSELGITVLLATHSSELAKEAEQVFKASNDGLVCRVEEETTR